MATIITKNSSTASAVPLAGNLVQGELAVNVTDRKLYTKDSGGNVVVIAAPGGVVREARTSNTQLVSGDASKLIDITSGTFTQTFAACSLLGSGWFVYLQNTGTGEITLDPNASETIDGVTSFVMYPNEVRLIQCDGSALRSFVIKPFVKTFLASGSFAKPPGYSYFGVDMNGAGGGGGGGASRASLTAGSGSGGGGGAARQLILDASVLSASETITCGLGGAGGTAGGTGASGGNTTAFGVTVYGGGQGSPVTVANSGGGGSWYGIGNATSGGVGSLYGGLTDNGFDGGAENAPGMDFVVWGGGAGGTGSTNASPANGALPIGNTRYAGGAGGGGGGANATTSFNGANGRGPNAVTGGLGATTSAAAGAAGVSLRYGGGGGAGRHTAGTAGAGGAGGPGAGGGGGGGAYNGTGGAGGNGGDGFVIVWGIV